MVKHKILYPDRCCGYTLDQAAALEREIRRFLESLPPLLRFTGMDGEFKEDTPQFPEADIPQWNALQMQRCTLMIMAQRLMIMVYLPFLRQHLTSPFTSMSSMSDDRDTSSGNSCNPVLHPIYHAAQSIIQASLQLGLCKGNPSHPRRVPPLLLGLYPAEKALLDAVVICTYIRTFHGSLFPGHTAANSAISGMRMLWDSTLGTECRAVFERLKRRFRVTFDSSSAYGVKRKHEQIAIRAAGTESPKYGGEPSTNLPQKQLLTMQERRNSADGKRNGITLSNVRDPETGQKDKKHAKKSHVHPSIGVRVRGKETPFFRRPKIGSSPSTSASNIGADDRASHGQQGLELQSTLDPMTTPMTEGQPSQLSSHVSNMPAAPPTHEPVHRSRSRSLDQDSRHQSHLQHNSPSIPSFIAQFEDRDDHLRTNNVAHAENYNRGYQQPDSHVNAITLPRSFEGSKEHEQQSASFSPAYLPGVSPITVASSPYSSSGHVTPASGSPYTASGKVVPASVTSLGQAIVSHPPAPSYTHAYYHMGSSNGFNAITYNQIQGQEDVSYTGARLDTAGEPSPSIVSGDTGGMGMAATVPSPPVYEKARSTMFDVKPPMDMLVQQQMHHRYMLQHQTTYGVDQQNPISIGEPAWAPQPTISVDASQRFWDPPVEQFKYFHS